MNAGILQSGQVTPGHLAAWTTDGVLQDAGVTFLNTYGLFVSTMLGVNFNNANTDNAINVNLPAGYTRYRIDRIVISGASGTLTTATVGVFTEAAALGTAIVASGSAVTVSTASSDTNNNMQSLTIVDQNTLAWIDTPVFFRVQTPQGSPALATVTCFYQPLP